MSPSKFDMFRLRHCADPLGIAMIVMLVGSTFNSLAQGTELQATARIMTPGEIHELYRDKSWQWEGGAGYMQDSGRQFSAWVDSEKGKSWAEGRWIITETGRMCFDATWHSIDGAFPARTCFSHRIDNGTIYQRREPEGEWYIFLHAERRDDDEATKLTDKDLVTAHIASAKAALDSNQISEQ